MFSYNDFFQLYYQCLTHFVHLLAAPSRIARITPIQQLGARLQSARRHIEHSSRVHHQLHVAVVCRRRRPHQTQPVGRVPIVRCHKRRHRTVPQFDNRSHSAVLGHIDCLHWAADQRTETRVPLDRLHRPHFALALHKLLGHRFDGIAILSALQFGHVRIEVVLLTSRTVGGVCSHDATAICYAGKRVSVTAAAGAAAAGLHRSGGQHRHNGRLIVLPLDWLVQLVALAAIQPLVQTEGVQNDGHRPPDRTHLHCRVCCFHAHRAQVCPLRIHLHLLRYMQVFVFDVLLVVVRIGAATGAAVVLVIVNVLIVIVVIVVLGIAATATDS